MGLVDQIKSMVGADEESETYKYQCTVCQASFESPEPPERVAGCDNCGAMDVEPR